MAARVWSFWQGFGVSLFSNRQASPVPRPARAALLELDMPYRSFIAFHVALLLVVASIACAVGCVGQGGVIETTPPFHQISTFQGNGTLGSVVVGYFSFTYPIKFQGTGTITLQYPNMPHILVEGELIWEPVYPGQAPSIYQEIQAGRLAVTNARSVPVAMSAPGTIP